MRAFAMAISAPQGAFRPAVAIQVFAALLLSGGVGHGTAAIGTPVPAQASVAPDMIAAGAPSVELPILVYHHVRPGSTSALFVSPEEFDKQLEYLQYYGFRTISFTDLADYFEKGKPLPQRPIIISFDDGWENQYEYGFPILQKYHDTATIYVVTDNLNHTNSIRT